MEADELRDLLEQVQRGEVTPEQAAAALAAPGVDEPPVADAAGVPDPGGRTADDTVELRLEGEGDGIDEEEDDDLEEVAFEDLDEDDAAHIRERVIHLGPLQWGTIRVRQKAGRDGRKTFVVDARSNRRDGGRGKGRVHGRVVWDSEEWASLTASLQERAEELGRVGERLGRRGEELGRRGEEAARRARRGVRAEPGITHQVNGPLRRVVVRSAAKRIRIVGDPDVSGVAVTGAHELRSEDGVVTIEATPGSGEGFGPWLVRETVEVRMHPTVPLRAEVDAGDGLIEGVLGPIRLDVNAGRGRIRGARGPLELQVNAGSLDVEALLTEGHHAVQVNAGRCAVVLLEGSSVRVEKTVALGKADLYEEVTGEGRATLDLQVNLGSAWVRPERVVLAGAGAEDAAPDPASDVGTGAGDVAAPSATDGLHDRPDEG